MFSSFRSAFNREETVATLMQLTPHQLITVDCYGKFLFHPPLSSSGNKRRPAQEAAGFSSSRLSLFVSLMRASLLYISTSNAQHCIPARTLIPAGPLLSLLQDEAAFGRIHPQPYWVPERRPCSQWPSPRGVRVLLSPVSRGWKKSVWWCCLFLHTCMSIWTVQWTSTA